MSLKSWWLEGKVSRIDRQLHHLRGLQKIAREKKDDKQLERLTHRINALVAREETAKAELRSAT